MTAESRSGSWWVIRGNTFPIKDSLRKLGAVWDAGERAWGIDVNNAVKLGNKLRRVLDSAPAAQRR